MKKNILIIILLITFSLVFADDAKVSCLKTSIKSKLWNQNQSILKEDNYDAIIEQGIEVKGVLASSLVYDDAFIREYRLPNDFFSKVKYKNNVYYIKSSNLIPLNKSENFEASLISDKNSYYVPEYFVKTLYEKNPQILKNEEKQFVNMNNWFSRRNAHFNGGLIIYPSSITFSHLITYGYWIENIKKTDDYYELKINKDSSFVDNVDVFALGWGKEITDKLPFYNMKGDELYVKKDGDYVVLSDDRFKNACVFCKVDSDFVDILIGFMNTNEVDMSKITFPRHADGSCDYDISKKTLASQAQKATSSTNVAPNKTMLVNENLKLRSGEATSTQGFTVMSAGTTAFPQTG